jgi:hypothetical protein
VAEAVASLKDPYAQPNFLGQPGISEDLLPLLNKGRKGWTITSRPRNEPVA